MRVTLLGTAGGRVTGAAYVLETSRAGVMIACGLFRGGKTQENYNRLPERGRLGNLDCAAAGAAAHRSPSGPQKLGLESEIPRYLATITI